MLRLSPLFLALGMAFLVSGGLTAPLAAATTSFQVEAPGAQAVSVAGTFNGWKTDTHPLADADGDGVWTGTVELAEGRYEYMFVVDGAWVLDPAATELAPDGAGGHYGVLRVGQGGGAPAPSALAPATPAPAAPTGEGTSVTFRYQPVIGGVSSVHLAGSMNGWSAEATPLADPDNDGIWEVTLTLPRGSHEYKFVVNGDQWFPDDFAVEFRDDGFGGQNSIIQVGATPLIAGPGGNVEAASENTPLGLRQVTFSHKPSGSPREVVVAGTFNDWTVGKSPMADPDGDGVYTTTLLLPAGEIHYKFVVDGNWITDRASADSFVDDGFGGENSVLQVDDRFPAVEVALGDGRVTTAGIDHVQNGRSVNNRGDGTVEITLRAHRNDVDAVELQVEQGGSVTTVPARRSSEDGAYAYWTAEIRAGENAAFRYLPVYQDGETTQALTPGGFTAETPAPTAWWTYTAADFPPFRTPEWVKDAVIYQIFPERFRNGDPANDPDFTEPYYAGKNTLPPSGKTNDEYYHLTEDWYDVAGLTVSPFRTDGKPDYFSFYGGDIAGVRQGLDYLEDLGVTAIYFNPLFEAKSNHKYDCADYMKIDPHFGTNEEFKAFVDDAHARGIRIILDIVYNHCGNAHWAFTDAVAKGPESDTYDWFEFKRWPLPTDWRNEKPEDYYACWWGFGDLPDLNFDLGRRAPEESNVRDKSTVRVNEPLMAHLKEVTEYWIGTMDCDGVRLDVANEVPFWFWVDFNNWVKTVKPDAYIVGEIWGNASDWIGPTLFDATMNYAFFRDPVLKFLGQGRGTAREFDRSLAAGRNAYPSQSVAVMMNLLGSHDTVRFREQVGGDLNKVKLAMLFGMTYVGAPHIYYGDEIGMLGGKDPDCRRPFRWNWEEDPERVELHGLIRTLARARAEHTSLRRGSFTTLAADGSVFVYLRELEGERILVALNAGKATGAVDLAAPLRDASGVDLVTGDTVNLNGLTLPPESGIAVVLR